MQNGYCWQHSFLRFGLEFDSPRLLLSVALSQAILLASSHLYNGKKKKGLVFCPSVAHKDTWVGFPDVFHHCFFPVLCIYQTRFCVFDIEKLLDGEYGKKLNPIPEFGRS